MLGWKDMLGLNDNDFWRGSPILNPAQVERLLPYLFLLALICIALGFRPLLPVDETRYLSVTWEMYLSGQIFVPTMNFAPYLQKPPLLFWLIDLAWGIFGASRVAAMLVIIVASSLVIWLTTRLAKTLFPGRDDIASRIPWLVAGSTVFVIYSTLILFDMLLTVFVLAALLSLLAFARSGNRWHAVLAGLFIGLGVLTKGPVVLIHVGAPILLYPFWRDRQAGLTTPTFLAGAGLAILAALIPVAIWLVPATIQTKGNFVYDLVWNQSAGRVTGNLHNSHGRPFYFYIVLLPIMLMPWIFIPEVRRLKLGARIRGLIDTRSPDLRALRLLSFSFVAVLLVFSAISGKQPHYVVPMLPFATILFGYFMAEIPLAKLRNSAFVLLAIFGIGHAAASATAFKREDLMPLANFIDERKNADWAIAFDYQDEVGFLARLQKPLERTDNPEEWLRSHPVGYVIDKSKDAGISEQIAFRLHVERGYLVVLKSQH
ncbi:ArnT family glycosyltransferase [Mesorhizobium ventifaucium]|uniref:PMT_2 domain-containing protein n=1 Tax=Mesorhizobium ventifaucium TaxID=666020 RepID=A0ABM9DSW6_9HYPH|nr:glycosyltransferase family 39 protein [Mesorhizobium ventifaucium]CAH2399793.1 PMT_2 domain-containing protein [Mesorhizobium ventifaucium]